MINWLSQWLAASGTGPNGGCPRGPAARPLSLLFLAPSFSSAASSGRPTANQVGPCTNRMEQLKLSRLPPILTLEEPCGAASGAINIRD